MAMHKARVIKKEISDFKHSFKDLSMILKNNKNSRTLKDLWSLPST